MEYADSIAAALTSAKVDALLCVHAEGFPQLNVRYLSGFTGSSAAVLISSGHRVLFTDGRYQDQVVSECIGWEARIARAGDSLPEMISKDCRQRGFDRVGYEPEGITAGMVSALIGSGGVKFVPVAGTVEEWRRCKGPDELRAIETAVRIADTAMEATATIARGGVSEREIALEIEMQMKRLGSEEPAFATIVASGSRSALPHAVPTGRTLQAGDLVCIDCGATVDGYRSDITRDWVVGEPTNEQSCFYAAVMRAHNQALSLVRPGASSHLLNAAARAEFVTAGIEDCWRHSIGHGVGLAIHESPSLREGIDTVLVAGDVVTIEPGAYRSGWGGVRIEDLLVVTEDGARMLTAAPRELRVISA